MRRTEIVQKEGCKAVRKTGHEWPNVALTLGTGTGTMERTHA
jgi:hypothetical protein